MDITSEHLTPATHTDSPGHDRLRLGLSLNAGFSLATGLLLAIAPGTVGGWLGVDIDGWLRLLGVALIGHAAILAFVGRQDDPTALGKLNLMAIAPYPLMMLALVVTGLVDTGLGRFLVLGDGVVVGAIAAVQAAGLRRPRAGFAPQTA